MSKVRRLQRGWVQEARKMRRDAELLLAKAELLEVKVVDLDIAIGDEKEPKEGTSEP